MQQHCFKAISCILLLCNSRTATAGFMSLAQANATAFSVDTGSPLTDQESQSNQSSNGSYVLANASVDTLTVAGAEVGFVSSSSHAALNNIGGKSDIHFQTFNGESVSGIAESIGQWNDTIRLFPLNPLDLALAKLGEVVNVNGNAFEVLDGQGALSTFKYKLNIQEGLETVDLNGTPTLVPAIRTFSRSFQSSTDFNDTYNFANPQIFPTKSVSFKTFPVMISLDVLVIGGSFDDGQVAAVLDAFNTAFIVGFVPLDANDNVLPSADFRITSDSGVNYPVLGIAAVTVPEPPSLLILCLGALLFAFANGKGVGSRYPIQDYS